MKEIISKRLPWAAWCLWVLALAIPFVRWLQLLGGRPLDAYTIFPLLGLWLLSTFWVSYAVGAIGMLDKRFQPNKYFSQATGYAILSLLLLHPGLLLGTQWLKYDLLPPKSYENYVGHAAKIFVLIAGVAWLLFISYEFFMRLKQKPWVAKHWRWISLTQMIAMALVFTHSLKLGQHLQTGWLRVYWVILGVILVPCIIIVGRADWKKHEVSQGQK